jgi:flagellar protein FliJ
VNRVRMAEQHAERSGEATRSARRDQNAVEKLIDRQRAEDVRAEMKALEDAPAPVPRR